jgi:hypothetical protein
MQFTTCCIDAEGNLFALSGVLEEVMAHLDLDFRNWTLQVVLVLANDHGVLTGEIIMVRRDIGSIHDDQRCKAIFL